MDNLSCALLSIRKTGDHHHTQLEPARNNPLADLFLANVRDKQDIDDAIDPVDGSASLQRACRKHDLNCRYERRRSRDSIEILFVRQNVKLPVSQTVSATPRQKLLTSGSERSLSHGINSSEHYQSLCSIGHPITYTFFDGRSFWFCLIDSHPALKREAFSVTCPPPHSLTADAVRSVRVSSELSEFRLLTRSL